MQRFKVTEAAKASACGRRFYFDRKHKRDGMVLTGRKGAPHSGLGQIFHGAIARMNKRAATSTRLRTTIERASRLKRREDKSREIAVSLGKLVLTPRLREQITWMKSDKRRNLRQMLRKHADEISELVSQSIEQGLPVDEVIANLFGDSRLRLDVTFPVGPTREDVRVRGEIDYLFFDHRKQRRQIVDFKLTDSEWVGRDVVQVLLYALMHHQQHGTTPDVAIFYLYPERARRWFSWEDAVKERPRLLDRLASMIQWMRYDEPSGIGLKPFGESTLCHQCPWIKNDRCRKVFGSDMLGHRVFHSAAASAASAVVDVGSGQVS